VCELHYALPRDGAAREQLVGLGYLKSYEGMGRVRVECARGCSSPACRECHPAGVPSCCCSRECHTSRAWPPAAYSPGAWLRYALDTSQ
jgi:hypothetical protein